MHTIGIICEYNPLHLGHRKQLAMLRRQFGPDCGIVCLMSGNFVQRGHPAIFDKALRARAAVQCGADLVLELPVTYALSSAENFAAGGVAILGKLCTDLCFGAETADRDAFLRAAETLLSGAFPAVLRKYLDSGSSFPAARQLALEEMGVDSKLVASPNNILATEYCKAILSQDSPMNPLPILREGCYHDTEADPENPSATSVRQRILAGENWLSFVPEEAHGIFDGARIHTLAAGEKAVLAKLRTMEDWEFEALPYGSEGLWRKFMHACRSQSDLEEILTATKSKRYTRTRLDRMTMCAFLGITAQEIALPAPYARVLAFSDRGRQILKGVRDTKFFPNIGERLSSPYEALENRCGSLYGLFAELPEKPNREANTRVYYERQTN